MSREHHQRDRRFAILRLPLGQCVVWQHQRSFALLPRPLLQQASATGSLSSVICRAALLPAARVKPFIACPRGSQRIHSKHGPLQYRLRGWRIGRGGVASARYGRHTTQTCNLIFPLAGLAGLAGLARDVLTRPLRISLPSMLCSVQYFPNTPYTYSPCTY